MTEHVVQNARSGAIVVLHVDLPSRGQERRALPRIVEALRDRGHEFVTAS